MGTMTVGSSRLLHLLGVVVLTRHIASLQSILRKEIWRSHLCGHSDDELRAALSRGNEQAFQQFVSTEAPKWMENVEKFPFNCTACGKCCRTTGSVYLSPQETQEAATLLDVTVPDFIDTYASHTLSDGRQAWIRLKDNPRGNSSACVFLDEVTNYCQIYQARPLQCRTYPFWPSIMKAPESWDAECRRTDNDNTSKLPLWTPATGGCEGMRQLKVTGRGEPESGVTAEPAYRQLYDYILDSKRFPKGAACPVEKQS